MFQGLYKATSGMLTQNRNLNVISNNMANVSTSGYKSERYMATTFEEVLISRIGNKDKSNPSPLGTMSMIRASDETVTDYTNTGYYPTRNALDFAISGNGFFCIQSGNGVVYTRNGSFTLDDQGYLTLPTIGRVLGENGPIRLGTDKIRVGSDGSIYDEETNRRYGTLRIADFQNYDTQLVKTTGNVFIAPNGGAGNAGNDTRVVGKALEYSNVDAVKEMVQMMSAERALQSSSEILKMYDQLTGKIVSQLGPA